MTTHQNHALRNPLYIYQVIPQPPSLQGKQGGVIEQRYLGVHAHSLLKVASEVDWVMNKAFGTLVFIS